MLGNLRLETRRREVTVWTEYHETARMRSWAHLKEAMLGPKTKDGATKAQFKNMKIGQQQWAKLMWLKVEGWWLGINITRSRLI